VSVNNISSKTLETLLETGFGATGASYGEKVSSVESKLPTPLVVQLRAVHATAKQLETGGTVDISSYRRMLESSAEQLQLLAGRAQATPAPVSPAASIAPQPVRHVPRVGVVARKAPRASRLRAWLFETRQAIPKRAHRISHTWRVPSTALALIAGGAAGWFIAGIGGAIAGALVLGVIAFFSLSENAVANGLWAQTRAVEGTFAVLRLLGRTALAVGAIVVVGVVIFFVIRLWNVR
jgi:hypothetical protein